MSAQAYPLAWPLGWPRSSGHERNYQFKMSDGDMVSQLYAELDRLGATDVVVSSNMEMRLDGRPTSKQRALDDPGVAVYFMLKGHEQCIPCDKWDRPIDNLHAVGLAIQAIRGFERWGTGQMVEAAFRGFTALPSSATSGEPVIPKRPWYEVLGVSPESPIEVREAAYKAMRRKTHPDTGGSEREFNEVQRAYEESKL